MIRTTLMAMTFTALILPGCGTSESLMKDRYAALPTSVLCQKLVDGDMAGWQEKWAGEIISQRGENCRGVRPSPRASSQQVIIKDCSKKNYGSGWAAGVARGMDGC